MKYLLIFAICAVFFFIFTPLVLADSGIPEGVLVFHVEDKTCIAMAGKFECWCTYSCDAPLSPCETPRPTDIPGPTPTDAPNPTPTNVPQPTPTSPPPEPTPEPKPACNRGLGNGPEDCDPGNSGGKPGNAGEDNE